MITTEYKIAYNEVLEILKYVAKEDLDKIPKNMLDMFKSNASSENNFNYNPTKTLQEQNVSETARAIIAILFRNYWATSEQKEKILSVQNNERERIKQEKYNPDNIFKNRNTAQYSKEEYQAEQTAIVEYKEKNFLQKLFDKIKHIFKRK